MPRKKTKSIGFSEKRLKPMKKNTQKVCEGMKRRGVNTAQSHSMALELGQARVGSWVVVRRVESDAT